MTALLLDLGNSRWKMASDAGAGIGTVVSGNYDDLNDLRSNLNGNPQMIGSVWLASVAGPEATHAVVAALQETLKINVRRVRSTDVMPNLVSGYRKPEQLGIDRLLAMVAARAVTPAPLCVVDAGTAVTIDFVAADGQHLGGFILPGGRMLRECLLANTAIPRDDFVDEGAVLGRDTPTAVALAGRYAVTGIVEHFTGGSRSLFPGAHVHTFVGGGDADQILKLLPQPCTKLDHLVLRGLSLMAAGGES
jgi:type III pantothenate kinase